MVTGARNPYLITKLYEAALEKGDLSEFAAALERLAGVNSIAVWLADKSGVVDMGLRGPIVEAQEVYISHYSKLDVWNPGARRMGLGRLTLACEHTSEQELVKTAFYNDFARHLGIFRPLGATLKVGTDTVASIGIEQAFAKRLFEEKDKKPLAPLLPHLKAALQLRINQRRGQIRRDLRSNALDALAFGAVVCTNDARIVLANSAAEELARAGAGVVLSPREGGIRAETAGDTQKLRRLIHDVAAGGASGGLRLTGVDGIAALLGLVTPLPSTFGVVPGHVMVALRSVRDSPVFKEGMLASLFSLSPSQAAIALALYNDRSPEEIAAERGNSITTIRTHLKEIFARTGTENQRGLVRLLSLLPPIR